MEDREVKVEEPRRIEQYDVKPQVNGDHRLPSSSPQQPPRKRIRYTEPPIWAQSVRKRGAFVSKVNGKQPAAVYQSQVGSSPLVKAETNGNRQVSPAATRQAPPPDVPDNHPSLLLGPWEYSITGNIVSQQMTKLVADFLYLNVLNRGDLGELASRGVEIEIEAKLGQLIDKETNERFSLPVTSECILMDSARRGFRSSMTESQHRTLNEFLNAKVAETHPANPGAKSRVKIDYLHRREIDKFYELPPAMHVNLPAAVRKQLNARHTVKVRVTHDQKTNQVLAKIIKARINDLDIYNPQSPLDCRISINLEMRYDGDIEDIIAAGIGERIPDRSKDRLSYTQSFYQIDLTQVTQVTSVNGQNRVDKEHELEIELSTAAVMEQGRKAASNEPNEYLALVGGLIDNMRVLSRNVPWP
ncbi:mRNA triphosphatase CET1 [Stipitochalara longipes BDJ]|nr:mRNA triphosphatase CET1 [Stipitochalara longipes BDJ]